MTKYCTDSDYGKVDNKTELEFTDDAARVNWGGSWRMPSAEQMSELFSECKWTMTWLNGIYCFKVSSKKNSNSIVFRAHRYSFADDYYYRCKYWSRTLSSSFNNRSYTLSYDSGDYCGIAPDSRYNRCSVRPVLGTE